MSEEGGELELEVVMRKGNDQELFEITQETELPAEIRKGRRARKPLIKLNL